MRHHILMALVIATVLAWPKLTLAATYNVRESPYNAQGDGVADDTTAIQNAINAVGGGGGEVYIPAGKYKLTASLVVYGSIRLRGDGQRTTTLHYQTIQPDAVGIYFVSQGLVLNNVLNIKGMSLIRDGGVGVAAIYAAWPNIAPPPGTVTYAHGGGLTTVIEDVHIGFIPATSPQGQPTSYWATGIRLRNATHAKIATFNIQGPGAGVESTEAGIDIDGLPDDTGRSVGVTVHDGTINGFQRGLQMSGNRSEGLHAQSLLIRNVRWGLELLAMGGGTSITTCDISAQWRGIMLFNGDGDIAVTNNIIYRETDQGFFGIQIYNYLQGKRHRIMGNIVVSAPGTFQPHYGIGVGGNADDTIIMGNIAYDMTYGIFLQDATVDNSIVLGNVSPGAFVTTVNNGTNTLLPVPTW